MGENALDGRGAGRVQPPKGVLVKGCSEFPRLGRWVSCKTLCDYLDISDETVRRCRIPWQDDPVPHRFRYKDMKLREDAEPEKRYWLEDAEAFLSQPAPTPQTKKYTPVFHKR